MVRLAIVAIMGLVICFALYLTGRGVINVWRGFASARWPRTQGVVTAAGETVSVDRDRHADTTFYAANTTIRYSAQGRDYTTNLIHFGQTFGSSDESEAAMQILRYPVGAAVNVSYNPSVPSMAVSKPGIHADAFWLVGAGLAFLLPSIMCLVVLQGVFGRGDAEFGAGFDSVMGIVVGIFAAIFCLLGILALSYGGQNLWNARASQSWPTAPGTVVSASVSENHVHISSAAGKRNQAVEAPVESTFIFAFVYAYDVGGVTHYGNLRRFGGYAGAGEDWAEKAARQYPPGSKVAVAYHPGDPDLAVIEPGIINEALVLPGFGALAVLFGIAVLVFIVPGMSR